MYAIVNIAGQQLLVEPNKQYFVHRLAGKEGDVVEFHEVLLLKQGDTIRVGSPYVEGAMVKAKIVEHVKGDKVLVFKKKRRKGYKKLRGHRQFLTKIAVETVE